MRQHVVCVGVAIFAANGAEPSVADDWADCIQRAKPDIIVRACTSIIESAEARGERLAEAYNNRGVGYYIRGDYRRAIADYDAAIELKPLYAIAHYNRGAAHLRDGDRNHAMDEFGLVTRLLPPDDPWRRLALAHIEEIASPKPPTLQEDRKKPARHRVRHVREYSVLNMRSGPGTDFPVVAEIPANGNGISVRTCKVVEGYRAKWCETSWRNYSGWTSACCLVSEETGLPPD